MSPVREDLMGLVRLPPLFSSNEGRATNGLGMRGTASGGSAATGSRSRARASRAHLSHAPGPPSIQTTSSSGTPFAKCAVVVLSAWNGWRFRGLACPLFFDFDFDLRFYSDSVGAG